MPLTVFYLLVGELSNLLEELTAHADICRCNPCRCDPTKGNECSCNPIEEPLQSPILCQLGPGQLTILGQVGPGQSTILGQVGPGQSTILSQDTYDQETRRFTALELEMSGDQSMVNTLLSTATRPQAISSLESAPNSSNVKHLSSPNDRDSLNGATYLEQSLSSTNETVGSEALSIFDEPEAPPVIDFNFAAGDASDALATAADGLECDLSSHNQPVINLQILNSDGVVLQKFHANKFMKNGFQVSHSDEFANTSVGLDTPRIPDVPYLSVSTPGVADGLIDEQLQNENNVDVEENIRVMENLLNELPNDTPLQNKNNNEISTETLTMERLLNELPKEATLQNNENSEISTGNLTIDSLLNELPVLQNNVNSEILNDDLMVVVAESRPDTPYDISGTDVGGSLGFDASAGLYEGDKTNFDTNSLFPHNPEEAAIVNPLAVANLTQRKSESQSLMTFTSSPLRSPDRSLSPLWNSPRSISFSPLIHSLWDIPMSPLLPFDADQMSFTSDSKASVPDPLPLHSNSVSTQTPSFSNGTDDAARMSFTQFAQDFIGMQYNNKESNYNNIKNPPPMITSGELVQNVTDGITVQNESAHQLSLTIPSPSTMSQKCRSEEDDGLYPEMIIRRTRTVKTLFTDFDGNTASADSEGESRVPRESEVESQNFHSRLARVPRKRRHSRHFYNNKLLQNKEVNGGRDAPGDETNAGNQRSQQGHGSCVTLSPSHSSDNSSNADGSTVRSRKSSRTGSRNCLHKHLSQKRNDEVTDISTDSESNILRASTSKGYEKVMKESSISCRMCVSWDQHYSDPAAGSRKKSNHLQPPGCVSDDLKKISSKKMYEFSCRMNHASHRNVVDENKAFDQRCEKINSFVKQKYDTSTERNHCKNYHNSVCHESTIQHRRKNCCGTASLLHHRTNKRRKLVHPSSHGQKSNTYAEEMKNINEQRSGDCHWGKQTLLTNDHVSIYSSNNGEKHNSHVDHTNCDTCRKFHANNHKHLHESIVKKSSTNIGAQPQPVANQTIGPHSDGGQNSASTTNNVTNLRGMNNDVSSLLGDDGSDACCMLSSSNSRRNGTVADGSNLTADGSNLTADGSYLTTSGSNLTAGGSNPPAGGNNLCPLGYNSTTTRPRRLKVHYEESCCIVVCRSRLRRLQSSIVQCRCDGGCKDTSQDGSCKGTSQSNSATNINPITRISNNTPGCNHHCMYNNSVHVPVAGNSIESMLSVLEVSNPVMCPIASTCRHSSQHVPPQSPEHVATAASTCRHSSQHMPSQQPPRAATVYYIKISDVVCKWCQVGYFSLLKTMIHKKKKKKLYCRGPQI